MRFIPSDIWEIIFHSCSFTGAELKEFRLVNKAFNECTTPLLFEHACSSVTEDNIANLKELLDRKDLGRHVKTLWIDCAVFDKHLSLRDYNSLTFFQLEDAIEACLRLNLKGFQSVAQQILTCSKSLDFKPPVSMSVEERSLQKSIRAYYMEGYKKYHSMAEFQANYGKNQRVAMLRACLQTFDNLESIFFFTDWTPPSAEAIMDWWDILSRPLTDDGDTNNRLPLVSEEISKVVTETSRSIREPSFPGSSARSMRPVHLRPTSRNWSIRSGSHDLGQDIGDLALASSGLRTNLKYISYPACRYPGTEPWRRIWRSNTALISVVPEYAHDYGDSLRDLFRPLRELYLDLETRVFVPDLKYPRVYGERWLCSALQSMQGIENLELTFRRHPYARYGLFNILQTRDFEEAPPSMDLTRRLAPCHQDFDLEFGSSRHSECWRPVCDHPAVPPSDNATRIRVLEPNPWPQLRRLVLREIPATKGDLASLFITVASSLRELELSKIIIGQCPCSVTPEQDWEERGRWTRDLTYEGEPWYDAVTMISNVLDLRKFELTLNYDDQDSLKLKLAKIFGHKKQYPGGLESILAEYVIKAEGEGLALWLSNTLEVEGNIA
jgi:hypothetical protein